MNQIKDFVIRIQSIGNFSTENISYFKICTLKISVSCFAIDFISTIRLANLLRNELFMNQHVDLKILVLKNNFHIFLCKRL